MRVLTTRHQPTHALQRLVLPSPRERQVLRLVALGLANKCIAYELGIALGTVKSHLARILADLGFSNRTQITRWALLHPDVFAGHAVPASLHPPSALDGDAPAA
jgi:DNA-binding NarL/FixJ family response regulator